MRRRVTKTMYLAIAVAALSAHAADNLFGLPLVPAANGWARYVTDSSTGPVPVVLRVGAPGEHQGKRGRWYSIEVQMPEAGLVTVRMLIKGDRAVPENVLHITTSMGDEKPQTAKLTQPSEKQSLKPQKTKTTELSVSGQKLTVDHYEFEGGARVGWSAQVPGLGLVYVAGPSRMALVAVGRGKDAWENSAETSFFPEGVFPTAP